MCCLVASDNKYRQALPGVVSSCLFHLYNITRLCQANTTVYAHAILCLQQRRSLLQAVPYIFHQLRHILFWCEPTNQTCLSTRNSSVNNFGCYRRSYNLIILPSLDQYTNRYSFFSLKISQHNFNIHQISVSVLAQYYQPNSIRLDDQPISCSWNAIYNNEDTLVGYGCHRSVTGGVTHVVSHDNQNGRLAVLVYGGSSSVGYGYLAGLHLTSSHSGTCK